MLFGVAFKELTDEDINKIENSQFVKEMEDWPSENSVKIIDDIIIIKFPNDVN